MARTTTPPTPLTPGELRSKRAELKKTVAMHAVTIKMATKSLAAAKSELDKAGKVAEAARKAAIGAANKAFDAVAKVQNKAMADAIKARDKAEAELAASASTNETAAA